MGGLIKKTQASRSATRLEFHVVGHFVLHDLVGGAGVAGEDETFGEGGIGGMNEVEVDEVLLLAHAPEVIELLLEVHELLGHTFMNWMMVRRWTRIV